MGAFRRHAQACDRARQWASLELDGELSELEQLGLRSHLAGCAECAPVVADMRRIALELRGLPLEQPRAAIVLPARPGFPQVPCRQPPFFKKARMS